MTRTITNLAVVLALALTAACSSSKPDRPAAQAPHLAVTLETPTDAALNWRGAEPKPSGQAVEFATESGGNYTLLEFVGSERTSYEHPDLMPETPFYYRVRPYYGPASKPVAVTLPPGEFSEKDQGDDHEWAPPMKLPGGAGEARPVRTFGAAPTGLKATVMHANGIRFTWTDHASDELGFLLEVKPVGADAYRVAALLDPDITSFGLITLPGEKNASYRIRPYYYGTTSNVVHVTTGKDQP